MKPKYPSKLLRLLLICMVLFTGAFFRFYHINWDDEFHLHPDERFLTMVATSISPVANLDEYFNTQESTLNPHNVIDSNGNSTFSFFVYGTLPLFAVRYLGECCLWNIATIRCEVSWGMVGTDRLQPDSHPWQVSFRIVRSGNYRVGLFNNQKNNQK